jgi:hypothetical protein
MRPIARKLLDAAVTQGPGRKVQDMEGVTAASIQVVYTGRRVVIELKGRMLGSPVDATIERLDSLSFKSGQIVSIENWPVGIDEIWADLISIDGGQVSLYFAGRE